MVLSFFFFAFNFIRIKYRILVDVRLFLLNVICHKKRSDIRKKITVIREKKGMKMKSPLVSNICGRD